MRQIIQNMATGETTLEDVPEPQAKRGFVTIRTKKSLISTGTEKSLVNFGKLNWFERAKSHPDKVKQAFEKVQTDGIFSTYEAIKSKVEQPLPLGYCNVGVVLDGEGTKFQKNQRVVSNGFHAEVVQVSPNLAAKVPDGVSDEEASFTVIGAIALQGIRLLNPGIGDKVVVIGLGLVGLLTVQLLKANGCSVLGVDIDKTKCSLAEKFGADVIHLTKSSDILQTVSSFTGEVGADGVIICASSQGDNIISDAAKMSRKKGKIILVGVVGLNLNRADFYEKELTFQVSCSYGPGRYDPNYENKGQDYPISYVRWTAQRNFEAVLKLISDGLLCVKPLITETYKLDRAQTAYENVNDRNSLGIIIDYDNVEAVNKNSTGQENKNRLKVKSDDQINIAFLGAGNYASRVLMPNFDLPNVNLQTVISEGGISASFCRKKFGFVSASTDPDAAFMKDTDAVVIATRHNLHAEQVINALKNNKHVFVEKPLALSHDEVDNVMKAHNESKGILMVGYNRRFSKYVTEMKSFLENRTSPKSFIMTMNAGFIPPSHWTQDPKIGGGRIIGEACHYVDLMRYLASSKITSFKVMKINDERNIGQTGDNCSILLGFEDGSMGTIHYLSSGNKSFPKERIEVFCEGAVMQLDNFKRLRVYGCRGFSNRFSLIQDKGQKNCIKQFLNGIVEAKSPIPSEEIFEVSKITIDIADELKSQIS